MSRTMCWTGPTAERFDTRPYAEKWQAFGWNVLTCDGHDIDAIQAAIHTCHQTRGVPSVILAQTVKGKGFSFAENVVAFHHGLMTQAQYVQALKEGQA